MEITVSKADLLKELVATQGVVERKTTIPILSNFLFEAAGDKLSLTATDLDISLRTSCPAKVKKEGSCTVPARKFYEYAKLLPDGEISIKLLENHWVHVAWADPIPRWSVWPAPTSLRCPASPPLASSRSPQPRCAP